MFKTIAVATFLLGTGVAVATMLPRGPGEPETCADTLLGKAAACIRPVAVTSPTAFHGQPGRQSFDPDLPTAPHWDAI